MERGSEIGGRDGSDRNRETRATENVVWLPRDWLGPRDELVPIGPAAIARARAAREAAAGAAGPESVPEPPLPPTAHDFWGEGAAALHDAIQGPIAPHQERTAAPPPQDEGRVAPPPSLPRARRATPRRAITSGRSSPRPDASRRPRR